MAPSTLDVHRSALRSPAMQEELADLLSTNSLVTFRYLAQHADVPVSEAKATAPGSPSRAASTSASVARHSSTYGRGVLAEGWGAPAPSAAEPQRVS